MERARPPPARILARALNCLDLGVDGEPCGKCENCLAVANGSFFDLVELDAASNNGVDAIRDLIQGVHLGVGATSRKKVYIIDEVHMLSAAASNTLLKTLEEPPAHVVFVLATTDPQKVLPTIRSRTQHFEFTLLSHEELTGHLADILAREGIEADAEAIDLIARKAGGSARDALSALDQALAVGGASSTAPRCRKRSAACPSSSGSRCSTRSARKTWRARWSVCTTCCSPVTTPRRIADDMLRTLRDAFLSANGNGRVPYDGPAEEAARLPSSRSTSAIVALVRGIEMMGQAIVDIRGQAIADPRLVLEVAVVRLARREARPRRESARSGRATRTPDSRAADRERRRAAPHRAGRAERRRRRSPNRRRRAQVRGADARGALAPEATCRRAAARAAKASAAARRSNRGAGRTRGDRHLRSTTSIEAWPDRVRHAEGPFRAVIQEAQPIGVEDGVVVFGAPPGKRFETINARFRSEADAIKAALEAPARIAAPPQAHRRTISAPTTR